MSEPDVTAEWQKRLEDLREANKQKLIMMSRDGIQPENISVLHSRIDWLIQSIAEAMGPEAGEQFKLLAHTRWQEQLRSNLEQVHEEGRKARLAGGMGLGNLDLSKMTQQPGR